MYEPVRRLAMPSTAKKHVAGISSVTRALNFFLEGARIYKQSCRVCSLIPYLSQLYGLKLPGNSFNPVRQREHLGSRPFKEESWGRTP